MEKKFNTNELIIGLVVLVGSIAFGLSKLASDMLVFRLIIGIGLGYVLSRAYTGFAGSVNRAYNGGSTKLMRAMVMMFFVTAVAVAGFLVFNIQDGEAITKYNLWVNPINIGLLLGGLLFGFGMTFSTCCASGVMTDLVTDLPKAFITLIFFAIGVFVGFPLQNTADWINVSWFNSASFENGVFMPDLFKGTPLNGFLMSVVVTGILCLIIVVISYYYEASRKRKGTYHEVPSERLQELDAKIEAPEDSKSMPGYLLDKIFVKSWSLTTGAFLLSILFITMFAVTKAGWGASTPYGHWVGKVLTLFGVSGESLEAFTHVKAETFTAPFLANGTTVQNIGIVIGALVFTLTSGQMAKTARGFFSYPKWQYLLFIMGGFTMGFGTRLSNGCNVGALYTPIASFSVAGWVFFAVLVIGGIIGNIVQKKIFDAAGSGK